MQNQALCFARREEWGLGDNECRFPRFGGSGTRRGREEQGGSRSCQGEERLQASSASGNEEGLPGRGVYRARAVATERGPPGETLKSGKARQEEKRMSFYQTLQTAATVAA